MLGREHLPLEPVELYLEFLRQTGRSSNTVKSYARALASWWDFLDLRERRWDQIRLEDLTAFLSWLRTGLPPNVEPIEERPRRVSEATIAARLQGVRSFYRFHQMRGVDVAGWLTIDGNAARSPYIPFLAHTNRGPRPVPTVRVRPKRRAAAPTLTPLQMTAIKDHCGYFDTTSRQWVGSVRNRLFFALLEETGLRIGEALSLQHRDWHSGGGENPYLDVVPRPHPLGQRVKSGCYRKLYISDELDRLYAEYVWQLCDAGMDTAVISADASLDDAYVFVNLAGRRRFEPMRPETIYKLVTRISRDLGDRLPTGWSPHWFRHTHATALLLAGRPIHVVSRRLGHADVQTTLNTYAWVTEDDELRALATQRATTENGGL